MEGDRGAVGKVGDQGPGPGTGLLAVDEDASLIVGIVAAQDSQEAGLA